MSQTDRVTQREEAVPGEVRGRAADMTSPALRSSRSQRNQGFASEALAALTEFAWTIPGLHRVALFIEPWSVDSLRTAVRAGYLREGVLASHQMIDGERRDMALYAAIRQTGHR